MFPITLHLCYCLHSDDVQNYIKDIKRLGPTYLEDPNLVIT
jgi:hypothetical protein